MVAAAGAVEDAIRVGGLADIKAARIKVQTPALQAPRNVAELVCNLPVWGTPALPQQISA